MGYQKQNQDNLRIHEKTKMSPQTHSDQRANRTTRNTKNHKTQKHTHQNRIKTPNHPTYIKKETNNNIEQRRIRTDRLQCAAVLAIQTHLL